MAGWCPTLCFAALLSRGTSILPELPVAVELVPDDWTCADINSNGMPLIGEDTLQAVRIFTAGSSRHSHDPTMFNNLAVALATLAMGGPDGSRLHVLCDAEAAANLAVNMGFPPSELGEMLREVVDEEVRTSGLDGASCRDPEMLAFFKAAEALARAEEEEHVASVSSHCSEMSRLTLRPTRRERELGMWTASSLRLAWASLHLCGVLALEGVLDSEVLSRVAPEQAQLSASPQPALGEIVDVSSRGTLRREVKLPLRPPFTDPELIASPLILGLLKLLLGERVELDTFSFIESSPGSRDQPWHVDTPGPSDHTPAFGLVAVVPLVDVGVENGATEFLTGSHVTMVDPHFWAEAGDEGASDATPRLQFPAIRGDLALFDLRLRHRGRANLASAARPVLYMSYVRDWFRDATNFKDRQTRAWDSLPAASRRVLARLDGRSYVRQLEEALEKRGVDLRTLASSGDYVQHSLEL